MPDFIFYHIWKTTSFESLQVKCWKINQVASKYQMKKGLKKSDYLQQILHIWNSVVTKFQLKLTILNFCTRSIEKVYFQFKKEKIENCHQIIHILVVLGSKFHLQQISGKKETSIRKQKNKTSPLNYWISLNTKFQLELTIFIFWIRFAPQIFFHLKQIKWVPH